MKIVFLNGPYRKAAYSRCSRSPSVTKSGTIYYPFWLAYAAGIMTRRKEYEVSLVDAVAKKLDQAELVDYFRVNPPDLVFCDTSTPSIHEDLATAGAIKEAFSGTKVILVGTHATALPTEVLQGQKQIDAVIRGEYDFAALELAEAMAGNRDWETVAGLSFRRGDRILHTPQRELISDLDSLPFVTQVYNEYLRVEDYFFSAAQYPMVMTVTSRGCPHRCGWCLYPQVMHRGKYRTRSSANVAEEFAYIAAEMPSVREIGIEDDLFTGDRRRLREICERLIRQGNRLNFWCDTRVDLDLETMQLMKAAGCRLLIAGFESANQEILETIGKGTQVDQAFEFVRHAQRANLLVHGCFVLGNPGETETSLRQTLDFAKKLDPDTAQFFPMMVYPGTEMYEWAQTNRCLRTGNYEDWLTEDGLHNSVIDLPGLPGAEVVRFCDYARREFYLRKGYILKKLVQSLVNVHEARRNVKAFKRFARFLVKSE
jgi:anaerobic magnesium-protoporphyrin IX monomethyl ester cyclase